MKKSKRYNITISRLLLMVCGCLVLSNLLLSKPVNALANNEKANALPSQPKSVARKGFAPQNTDASQSVRKPFSDRANTAKGFSLLDYLQKKYETNLIAQLSGLVIKPNQAVATLTSGLSLSLNPNGVSSQQNVKVTSSSPNLTGSITVEAWIKPTVGGVTQAIISRYQEQVKNPAQGGYLLYMTANNQLKFAVYQNAASLPSIGTAITGNTIITTNTWHHVAGVYDFPTRQLRIYLDGHSDAQPKTANASTSTSNPLRIGVENNSQNYYSGLIDEVRVTSTAVYTSDFTPQTNLTAISGAVGLWNFDNEANLGADATGNATSVGLLGTPAPISSTDVPGGGGTNQPPVSNPGGPYSGTVNNAVQFSGSGSTDADGTITSYSWNFGDSTSGSGLNPSHVYTQQGTYQVTLTVVDNGGAQSSATTTATINPPPPPTNQPPVANPGGPYSGTVGNTISFNGGNSSDPDGTITRYDWNFGDGAIGSGVTSTHAYSSPGTYTVRLTVTDNSNAQSSSTTTATITVGSSSSPVGYWKFDEGSSTIANDSSGNLNTGFLANGPVWAGGRVNSALYFDGVNDYVQIGSRSSLVMSNALTMSAWVNPASNTGSYTILNKEGEYEVAIQNGQIVWAIANSLPGWNWAYSGYVPAVGSWTHIAVTYDGSTVRTYANDSLVNIQAGSGFITDAHPSENDFRIGGRQCGVCVNEYFNGGIDEVRVYNRALSEVEVQALANMGNTPPTVSITGTNPPPPFTAPATITVNAIASDPDAGDSVVSVQFKRDGINVGSPDTTLPFSIQLTGLAVGTYQIAAVATDSRGAATTSASFPITVGSGTPPPSGPPPPNLTSNQIGRLSSLGNGSMRISYAYDALGRSTGTVHKLDGTNYVYLNTYGYPQNPSTTSGPGTVVITQTFPDNEQVTYTYDASGAQQSIKTTPNGGAQQPVINSVRRNARGQTTQVVYGNNAISTHNYNDSTNLFLNQLSTVIGASTLQNYTYAFDNNGNITGVADNVTSSLSATYGYNSLDQLTSMRKADFTNLPYGYDALGNLTNKEGNNQTYGGAQSCVGCAPARGPHALASSQGITYNYDANGNLISASDGTTITWNAENMPVQSTRFGITIQRFYLGETLWKKVESGQTTYYLPSLRKESEGYRKFFTGFAERSPDGTLKFYHNDHLGSASLMTDTSGNIIRRQAYMPFGEDRPESIFGSFVPKYQFNFKEKESSGFYDYGARLYNPATGRWISADTDTTDGINRYTYVSNNPLKYTDPTGHQQFSAELHRQVVKEAVEGLGHQQSVTIFFKGMLNGGIDRDLDNLMLKVLGTDRIASIPNDNNPADASIARANAAQAWMFRDIVEKSAFRLNYSKLVIATHSNGINGLALALEYGPIVPKELRIYAPNAIGFGEQSLKKLDEILAKTGNAPMKIYIGSKDLFTKTPFRKFVPDLAMAVNHFRRNKRVSIYLVNNGGLLIDSGHQIKVLAEGILDNKYFTVLVNGEPPPVSSGCRSSTNCHNSR